jgi:glycosyltransferase 2 family protein
MVMVLVERAGADCADPAAESIGNGIFGAKGILLLLCKLAVTIGCFWYLVRRIEINELATIARSLNWTWAALALIALMLQLPLAGLRWGAIVDAVCAPARHASRSVMIAICSVGIFFGQILPNPGGDAVRIWMLTRIGRTWVQGITSVLIDRAVGVLVLVTLGFIALLFPSALAETAGSRLLILAVLGTCLAAGLMALVLVPRFAPILDRWQLTRHPANLARACYGVFRVSSVRYPVLASAVAIHLLTILALWLLARAHGYALPVVEASVLFATIAVVSLLPISISGWGVREVAVTAMLQSYGVSAAEGFFFSVSFGVLLILASFPGAIVYALFTPKPIERVVT